MKDIITLEFEDGKKVEAELQGTFQVKGKPSLYAFLTTDDELFIYGAKVNGDDIELYDIDDSEYELARQALVELCKDA